MKKFKIILFMLTSILFLTSIVSASFLIVNNKISFTASSSSTNKYRIRFLDSNEVKKIMYVNSDYNLSLKDAPYYFDGSNNPIKWVCNDIVLNDFDSNISNNMDFTISTIDESEIDRNDYNNSSSSILFNNLDVDKYIYAGNFNMYYDGSNTNANNPGKLVNNDTNIAFGSTNVNQYTLSLNRDIVVTGSIVVGAYTGYYGDNIEYSQISYQGFIIGNYCTLDLAGHDIVFSNPNATTFNDLATLYAWGEVKDSKATGVLLLDQYSKYYASMVIEDIYHEKRIPYTYFSNDNPFAMYRCPYWTCKTIIKSGSIIQGMYRMDLGGNNSYSSHGDIPIIGSKEILNLSNLNISNFLIYLDDGYIERTVSSNDDLNADDTNIKNDLLAQKINYSFHDANITFDKFTLPISYSSISVNIVSNTYDFYISPYFSFYLYNSTIYLEQTLVFMPGTYLYVDNYSVINISYGKNAYQDGFVYGTGIEEISKMTIPGKNYQPVGGLIFLNEFYDMDDLKLVLGVLGSDNTEGYSTKIYQNDNIRSEFWNKLSRAKADIFGKINFVKQSYPQYSDIEFGGEINLYQANIFVNNYNQAIANNMKVKLYCSTFKTDWCRIFAGSGIFTPKKYRNVTGYYNYPLISNGYVLCNFNGQDGINNGQYKYDYVAKLIYNEKNSKETYAFMFNNTSMDNLSYQNDINGVDSLSGKYVRVEPVIENAMYKSQINYNSGTYLVWHGMYILYYAKYNGYYLGKFYDNTKYTYDQLEWFTRHYYSYLYQEFIYDSTTRLWKLNSNKVVETT